jgi:hypothetical protein
MSKRLWGSKDHRDVTRDARALAETLLVNSQLEWARPEAALPYALEAYHMSLRLWPGGRDHIDVANALHTLSNVDRCRGAQYVQGTFDGTAPTSPAPTPSTPWVTRGPHQSPCRARDVRISGGVQPARGRGLSLSRHPAPFPNLPSATTPPPPPHHGACPPAQARRQWSNG